MKRMIWCRKCEGYAGHYTSDHFDESFGEGKENPGFDPQIPMPVFIKENDEDSH